MTKLASYETDKGKKDILVVNYFRSDYIGFQLLKSVIAATISFCALFAVYAFYNFEELEYGKSIIILYLCAVGAYGVISYVLYASRYSRAKKSLKNYQANLRRLASMYDK